MTVKLIHKLREEIKAKIDVADENILKQIDSILIPKKNKNDIVAYSTNGKPLTLKQFRKEIEESKQQFKDGEFITIEEFEKVTKTW